MYKRKIRVEARTSQDGEPFFVTEELRVTFEMDTTLAQGLAKAKVVIYNLSLETEMKLLANEVRIGYGGDELTPQTRSSRRVYIRVYAGYEDELGVGGTLPIVIDGYVMNGTSQRLLPEQLTHLYILPLSSETLQNSFTSFNTSIAGDPDSAMKLEDVIRKMCTSAGYSPSGLSFETLPRDIREERLRGHTIEPGPNGLMDALNDLAEVYFFVVSPRAGGLGFYPRLDDSDQAVSEYNSLRKMGGVFKPFPINPVRLKGPIVAGVLKIEIPHVLDATLFPGMVVDIAAAGAFGSGDQDGGIGSNSLISVQAGDGSIMFYTNDPLKYGILQDYMIQRVLHRGDNYGQSWDSTLVCSVPTTTRFIKGVV